MQTSTYLNSKLLIAQDLKATKDVMEDWSLMFTSTPQGMH